MGGDKRPIAIDSLTIAQAVELETCVKCSACAKSCPIYDADKRKVAIPLTKLTELRYLLNKNNGILSTILPRSRSVPLERLEKSSWESYRCTLCGRCMTGCAFGIQNRELREALRSILYRSGVLPKPLRKIAASLRDVRNPFGADPKARAKWIEDMGFREVPVQEKADTVFFVGCSSAFSDTNRRIAYATASILNTVGERWTLLGERESCCGNPWIALGDQSKALEYAFNNISLIESLGVKRVVTSCASCYKMLKWKYPQLALRHPRFEVLHTTEFMERCIADNRIAFKKLDKTVTYHDPCELSRLGGVIEEPRRILHRLTDNYVEMPENRMDTYCCGGGAFLEDIDNELRLDVGAIRIGHAEKIHADILTSACPICRTTLHESAKKIGSDLRVMDITELLAEQMGIAQWKD